ncbi:hypothetical protein CANCADRAFT_13707, partial [Tortispora caseinolytica NRRL Y-17796]
KWVKMFFVSGGLLGTGVVLLKYTTPNEEQMLAKMSPAMREEYLNTKDARLAANQELLRQIEVSAKSARPAWQMAEI